MSPRCMMHTIPSLITLKSAWCIWFVTVSENCHACGGLFSPSLNQWTLNVGVLWVCLDRALIVAQFQKMGREVDTRANATHT
ncbi:hypothetical protein BS47DRAFT_1355458 [Hydnum rufescens UP504]|uniref:Uncharacterized protein n=1 Tax=Hydnum rufescens UP504 TaxID=1448309 RepID=A0A9P6AF60_9AGAM|nr:hypothetical protein BS47DRAFT_1355458 [Hydnum rufescens UP504]